jgi:murein DD-endopeptidase MepM/ murein hydrolase activator NlpD
VNGFEEMINHLNSKDDSLYRTILGTEPLPKTMRQAGIGGTEETDLKLGLNENKILNSTSKKLNHLYSKAKILNHSFDKLLEQAKVNKEKMLHIPAIMPIYNKDLKGTGAGFGMRLHPISGIRRMHEGIDFYAKTGKEVYATGNGFVKAVRYSKTFGNLIVIDHGYHIETYYAHLSKFNVNKGQKVKRGQVIGYVGNTGLSSGPHLHYEVHLNGKEVDPVHYFFGDLTPKQYEQIIILSKRDLYSMD